MQLQNTGMPRIISVCIQRVLRAQCNSLAFRPRAPCNQAEMCMNHAAAWGQFFFSSAAPTSGGWKLLRWDVYTLVEITQLWRHRHWWKLHRCDVIQTIGITKMWRHPHWWKLQITQIWGHPHWWKITQMWLHPQWWKLHSFKVIHTSGNNTDVTSFTLVEITHLWRHPRWWKLHSWVVIHNGGNYTALTSSTLVEIAQMGH